MPAGTVPTLETLLEAVKARPEETTERYMLDRVAVPAAFTKASYSAFRERGAGLFGVPEEDIVVVGSARLGYSVSPFKMGQRFRPQSDIDLVVVSAELFDRAWDRLAGAYPCIDLGTSLEAAYKEHQKGPMIRGWILPTSFPGLVPFQPQWFDALNKLSFVAPGRRPVRARLYRTWRHALHYHRWSLEECVRRQGVTA